MKRHFWKLGMISGVLLAAPLKAEETDATLDAYAAGYKAAFTCSAVFDGGKKIPDITKHEFTGIYDLVQDRLNKLRSARIDPAKKQVTVHYSDTMPPRISQWRPHLGCVQLPVGADASMVEHIPMAPDTVADTDPTTDDGAPWTNWPEIDAPTGNAGLDKAVSKAFTRGGYGTHARTTAILIATKDKIITENYLDGFTPTTSQRTWSVAKSIAASVIGAAVEDGILDVKAPAMMPEWSTPGDPRGQITLENLLQMASGLDSNRAGNRTDRLYIGGGLVTETSTAGSLEAIPGTRWKYANNDTLLAVRHLRAAINDDQKYLAYPFNALLHKIGMTHTYPETDWGGNFVMSSQVWTTSRDLLRLGLLHLNDGVWNGERILPEGWAQYVATPAPSQPPKPANDRPSRGYGAQWWLFQDFPGIPADTYAALGNRGQILMIIPSMDLLIVRRGYDLAGGQGFQMQDFAKDVVAALKNQP